MEFNSKISAAKYNYDNKRWVYVIAGIIIMLCIGTVYSYSVFRLPIETLFQIGATQSGLPYMTALAFYAIFMLVSGKHLDKHKPRNIILFGGIIVSLGWILSAFAPNIYVLTITYGLISGSGVGIVYGVPMAVVAKWFPEKKGFAVGMVLVGFGLSPLITAPLARFIVEQYGLMNSFFALGISFAIIISTLSLPFKYPDLEQVPGEMVYEESNKQSNKQSNKESNEQCNKQWNQQESMNTISMIKTKKFKGLYLNFIIGTMIGLMLIGMTSSIATELFKIPSGKVTLFMSFFAIFNGIGRPIFGWLTDKLSSKWAMLLSYGMIMSAASIVLIVNNNSIIVYAVSFTIFWFNLGAWLAIAPTSTLSFFGINNYSQNYGVVFSAYGVGAITGVLTSGLLIDVYKNYDLVFLYIIGLCLVGIIGTLKLISDK
jgi:MFS family permease